MSTPEDTPHRALAIALYHLSSELRLVNESLVALFALHLDTTPDREKHTGAQELFFKLNNENTTLSNRYNNLLSILNAYMKG